MTEKEEKVYMVNSLAKIKEVSNGSITDETPYSEYAEKVAPLPVQRISGVNDIDSVEPSVGDFVTVMKYTATTEESMYDTGYYLFQNETAWQIYYSCVIYEDEGVPTMDFDIDWLALGRVVSVEDGSYTVDVIGV